MRVKMEHADMIGNINEGSTRGRTKSDGPSKINKEEEVRGSEGRERKRVRR